MDANPEFSRDEFAAAMGLPKDSTAVGRLLEQQVALKAELHRPRRRFRPCVTGVSAGFRLSRLCKRRGPGPSRAARTPFPAARSARRPAGTGCRAVREARRGPGPRSASACGQRTESHSERMQRAGNRAEQRVRFVERDGRRPAVPHRIPGGNDRARPGHETRYRHGVRAGPGGRCKFLGAGRAAGRLDARAAERLEVSRMAVHGWARTNTLIAWKTTKRGLRIPAGQIPVRMKDCGFTALHVALEFVTAFVGTAARDRFTRRQMSEVAPKDITARIRALVSMRGDATLTLPDLRGDVRTRIGASTDTVKPGTTLHAARSRSPSMRIMTMSMASSTHPA